MVFNSVTYLLFLSAVVVAYWLLPRTARLWMLFLTSLAFYAFWRPEFTLLMLASAYTDYFAALRIQATQAPSRRRAWLAVSLAVNLGLLAYFKYLMFFVDNAKVILQAFGTEVNWAPLSIILPLGISFYTFQTISYTVDVYRRTIPAEKSFVLYGCFVTYFPQLVAGPILRAGEIIYQLERRPKFDGDCVVEGVRRILFGLFLKVVLADNLAPLVDDGFALPVAQISALDVLTLAFLFGFQIYFDFSAYSHIAIGSALLMGIRFPENFNFPYMANSPRDFWRRWHISLSSWIRDYLYLPLAGAPAQTQSVGGLAAAVSERVESRRSPFLALFLTWAIMGLWHGANWTFVVWGLYHALFIAAYRLLQRPLGVLPPFVRHWGGWPVTLFIAMIGWIPFRAQTLGDTFQMFGKLLSPSQYLWLGMRENNYLVAALVFTGFVLTYFIRTRWQDFAPKRPALRFAADTAVAATATALVFVFLRPINQFIYFQF